MLLGKTWIIMSKQSSHLVDANQLNSAVDCSNSRNVSAFKPATRISYYNLCELTRFKFGLFSSEAFLYIFFNFSKGFVSFGVMAAFKVCKLAFREHPIGIRGSRSRSARVCGRSSVGWPIVAEVLRNEFLSEALKLAGLNSATSSSILAFLLAKMLLILSTTTQGYASVF